MLQSYIESAKSAIALSDYFSLFSKQTDLNLLKVFTFGNAFPCSLYAILN